MSKIFNLKQSEDITAIIEKLWETGAKEIYLAAPKNAELTKNIVALKLLKREADRLEKTVVLVTKDDIGREMAKRVGLTARVVLPRGVEEANLPPDESETELEETEETEEKEILTEVPPQKYESMIEEEVRLKRETLTKSQDKKGFGDIRQKQRLVPELESKHTLKEEKVEIKLKPTETEDEIDSYLKQADEPYVFPHKVDWRKPANEDTEEETPAPRGKKRFFSSFKFMIGFIVAAVLVAAAVIYFVLPKAEIVLVPRSEDLTQDLSLAADKMIVAVSAEISKIPAEALKIDKKMTKEFAATAQKQVNDKAKGVITIYNNYSSAPQGLVEKTRFVSADGKIFRLIKAVTVPGAQIVGGKIAPSSVDAEVAADEPGPAYNVGPTTFKIPGFQGTPKYEGFSAESKNPMTGGATGLMKVVSQEEIDKAKNELWSELRSGLERDAKSQVSDGFKLLDEALKNEIISVEPSVAAGAPAEKFSLTLKGAATMILFDEKNVITLALAKNGIENDTTLDEKALTVNYENVKADFGKGLLSFDAKIIGKAVSKIDINKLKYEIMGKSESQIKQIFGQKEEIEKARILFWPFWVKAVPSSPDKIKIKISAS